MALLTFINKKLQLLQHGQDFEVRIQMQVSNGSKIFFSFILHLQKLKKDDKLKVETEISNSQ